MNSYYSNWSYNHFVTYNKSNNLNKPYICRLVPTTHGVIIDISDYIVGDTAWIKERCCGKWIGYKMRNNRCEIDGLKTNTEYFISVTDVNNQKSDVRLFRTGEIIGTPVNYLHPEDEIYSFSGSFLCSPSLVKLKSGVLLASMDVHRCQSPQNLTLIFRSEDNGKSWRYTSELMPCFWGKMFCVNDKLYMLGVSTEYGDILIGHSRNEGRTWETPTVIARGGGVCGVGWHRAPCVVLQTNGKIYTSVEYGSMSKDGYGNMVLYADAKADLLKAESWCITDYYQYKKGEPIIEGNVVEAPNGAILNILRYKENESVVLKLDEAKNRCDYVNTIKLPVAHTKFEILRHTNGNYYALGNTYPGRNVLALYKSDNLNDWIFVKNIVDCSDADIKKVGFQYPVFFFEKDELLILSRTAYNDADNFHNSNYITFHKVSLG